MPQSEQAPGSLSSALATALGPPELSDSAELRAAEVPFERRPLSPASA